MSRVNTHLDAIKAMLEALQDQAGAPLFRKVSFELDLFDAEDIDQRQFAAPHAAISLASAASVERPDGGMDLRLTLSIVLAGKTTPALSADAATLDLAIAVLAACRKQTFGQLACLDPEKLSARLVQKGTGAKGVALALVVFEQQLLKVIVPPDESMGLIGRAGVGGAPPETSTTFSEGGLSSEEQAIVNGWAAP